MRIDMLMAPSPGATDYGVGQNVSGVSNSQHNYLTFGFTEEEQGGWCILFSYVTRWDFFLECSGNCPTPDQLLEMRILQGKTPEQ